MIERKFIKENMRTSEIDEYISKEFSKAGYSKTEIQRTPLATRITVFVQKPGIVIGRGGKTIDALGEALKQKFGIENPQVDVQEISNPNLDATIVAKQISTAIERGLKYKRVANLTLKRIMDSGAVGVSIIIGGKVGGEKSRTEKFSAGYLKFAGEPAEKLSKAYAEAKVKLGLIGVQVRILDELPKERLAAKKILSETPKKEEPEDQMQGKDKEKEKATADELRKKEEKKEEPKAEEKPKEEKKEIKKEKPKDVSKKKITKKKIKKIKEEVEDQMHPQKEKREQNKSADELREKKTSKEETKTEEKKEEPKKEEPKPVEKKIEISEDKKEESE